MEQSPPRNSHLVRDKWGGGASSARYCPTGETMACSAPPCRQAALALAAPAYAATIELRADRSASPRARSPAPWSATPAPRCGAAGSTFLRGAVQEDGFVELTRQASEFSLPGGLARVGVSDPELMPELVQGQAVCECRSLTAAQIRRVLHLSLATAARRTGPALVTIQGTG